MHATITKHAIWGCACCNLQHSQPQIACVVIVACIELPQTVYIIACVREPRSRAHMLCASDAFKASERAQTRLHAFAHVRTHAIARQREDLGLCMSQFATCTTPSLCTRWGAFNAMRTWRALARIQCARWHALEVYMNDSKQIDPVRSSPDGRTDTHIFARPPP